MTNRDDSAKLSEPLVVNEFPHAIKERENEWITLSDGVRLAARIWLPTNVLTSPVPAILEYLPYRKRDGTATRDALTHPFFAGHGYACIRVDMRGSGESDGLLEGEYLESEQDDALEIIDWLVRQPWCNGNVGMIGISWGGFNGLQVAYRQPDALKAVVTLCSTDDRYADDIHYKGGALLNENQGWGATMLAYQSRPPDRALRKDWREVWLQRLEAMPLLFHEWLTHPHRDTFWQHGSVCEDYDRVGAAVLAVGGWGDAYSNAVPRMVRGLNTRTRAIIGPWVHKYPHFAVPQPAIGFLEEALRWWDRWLKGKDTGVEKDPEFRVYVMDSVRPHGWYMERAGDWYAVAAWPDAQTACATFNLTGQGLRTDATSEASIVVHSPLNVGVAAGEYCAIWLGPEMPVDQRLDDGGSQVFDSEPLSDELTIVGSPVLRLSVSADAPVAQLAVRLCDVWPDGASTRISYGVLNLTHRNSHEHPEALEPGVAYDVAIKLDDIGYRVPVGHRLRLAVSTAYWPLIWPSPTNASVTLHLARSSLKVPMLPADAEKVAPFGPATSAEPLRETMIRSGSNERVASYDMATNTHTVEILADFGERRIDKLGLVTGSTARESFSIVPDDPNSARAKTHWTEMVARDGWRTRTETFTSQTSDATNFYLTARLEAYEDDSLVFEREWSKTVPRNLL